jgi:hypothetical protein
VEEFVHKQNIARYRDLLRTTTDEGARAQLQKLLDEELARAAALPAAERKPPA